MAWFWIIVTIALLINAPGTRTPAPYPLPFPGRGAGKGERVRGPTDTFRYHSWIYSRMVPTRRYVHMNSTIRDSTQGDKVRRRTHVQWVVHRTRVLCKHANTALPSIEIGRHRLTAHSNEPRGTRTCIQQLSFPSKTSTSLHDQVQSAPDPSARTSTPTQ